MCFWKWQGHVPACKTCGAHVETAETLSGRRITVEKLPGGNLQVQRCDGKLRAAEVPHGKGTHVNHERYCDGY